MKKISENVGAWLRGLVWTAMIFGCAWASGQNYLVAPPAGHYRVVAVGAGEGVGIGAGVGAQNVDPAPKDDLFANTEVFEKNATHVTEITMDPDSLNMVSGTDGRRAHNMVLNVVRTFTYDKPGMYNMSDVDALRSKLNTGDWHCSVHIRDLKDGSGSDVCNKRRTDGMRESAIIEVQPKSLTFIHTIRKAGPGESEVGFFPMLPGMDGLSSLAMIDPEAFADMQIGLQGLPMLLGAGSPMALAAPLARLYTMTPDMKLKMDDMQKQMKDLKVRPFTQDELKKFKDQGKAFRLVVPDDDATPKAAPAPPAVPQAAPAVPQAAPVPTQPQTPQQPE